MSYYDWQHLIKPLQFSPVVQDTVENLKPLTITPVDDISVRFVTLQIPANDFSIATLFAKPYTTQFLAPAQLIGQYNYSVASAFTLVGIDALNLGGNFLDTIFCVRYRTGPVNGDGGTVKRYRLSDFPPNRLDFVTGKPYNYLWFPFPKYTGQVIQPNFVIEVWLLAYDGSETIISIQQDTFVKSGLLYIPTDYDDPTPTVEPTQILALTDLTTTLPENLNPNGTPVNAGGPWLTN
jgi:hypothetical protein